METKDGVAMLLEELTEQVKEMIATQAEATTTDYMQKITKIEESLLIPGKVGPIGCEYMNFNEFIKEFHDKVFRMFKIAEKEAKKHNESTALIVRTQLTSIKDSFTDMIESSI